MSLVRRDRGLFGGPLGDLAVVGADAWVVQVLRFGYQVPFFCDLLSLRFRSPCRVTALFHPWAGSSR